MAEKRLRPIRQAHPQTVKELARVELYYPFEWNGARLRVVPVKDNQWGNPCCSCHFVKQRNTHLTCPMMDACSGHKRKDRTSVKFISDEMSSMNYEDEIAKLEAEKANRKTYQH